MKKKSLFRDIFEVLVASVISFLLLNTYVAQAREIPSPSMVPTLQVGDRLIIEKLSQRFGDIKREDIIVFSAPPAINKKEDLIKRVIGLPGDEVKIRNGEVYVNGKALDEPYILAKPNQDFGPVKVGTDSYFVMGDNRNNSYDSRYWGTVPRNTIIGKAVFTYFPFNHITLFEK